MPSPSQQLETGRKRAVTQKNRNISVAAGVQAIDKRTKRRHYGRNVFSISWLGATAAFWRIASYRDSAGNVLFHSVNFTHSKSALCATSANTQEPQGGTRQNAFVRTCTNKFARSFNDANADRAVALQNCNQLFYTVAAADTATATATAANDTCWTLLRFAANSIRDSCLCSSELSTSFPVFFSFNHQLSVRWLITVGSAEIIRYIKLEPTLKVQSPTTESMKFASETLK